jgi:hypothetical protein
MRLSASCLLFIASFLCAATAQAQATPPEQLAMTGKWVMGYEPTFCALSGNFGEGDARVTAQFIRYSPTDAFDLKLYGKRFRDNRPYSQALTDFNSDGTYSQDTAFHGMAGDVPVVMVGIRSLVEADRSGSPPETVTPAMEAGITNVSISMADKSAFRLMLPSMGPAMGALRNCTRDLVRQWGFDPDVQSQLISKPEPRNPERWLRYDDYPEAALHRGENIILRYRLNVDASGKSTHCEILQATSAESATLTCTKLMQRAKFKPAIDSSGQPVASYYVGKTLWMIP